MAVVRAPYIHAKPEPWIAGCHETRLCPAEPYALAMPYQYVAPSNQTSVDMECKDSEASYEERSPGLRRSFSTPNTAQVHHQHLQHHHTAQHETQSQPGGAGEKKRNKLGYHRTSIACSHCRRRKIRCIASPDVQNRCVNCIRLKKECSFYPVDQQSGADARSRPPGRQAPGSGVASTTSSPAVASGSPGEMAAHHAHPTASGISQSSKAQTDEFYPPEVKVPSNGISSGQQYGFAGQPSAGWLAADVKPSESLNASWHSYPTESPMSTQFSPYPQSSTASATWASGTSETGSHDDMASWPDYAPPVRSLSLSESSTSHPQMPFLHLAQGQPFERRPSALSDVYTQSFAGPVAGIVSAGSMAGIEGQGPVVGAGAVPSNAEAWQQQLLSQGQNPYAKQEQVLFDDWQYDKAGGSEQIWLDEQRSQATASQAPSEAYYSA